MPSLSSRRRACCARSCDSHAAWSSARPAESSMVKSARSFVHSARASAVRCFGGVGLVMIGFQLMVGKFPYVVPMGPHAGSKTALCRELTPLPLADVIERLRAHLSRHRGAGAVQQRRRLHRPWPASALSVRRAWRSRAVALRHAQPGSRSDEFLAITSSFAFPRAQAARTRLVHGKFRVSAKLRAHSRFLSGSC